MWASRFREWQRQAWKSLLEIWWNHPGEGKLATAFYRSMFPPIIIGGFLWMLVIYLVFPLMAFSLLAWPFHDLLKLDWERTAMLAGVLTFYLGYWTGRRGFLKDYEFPFLGSRKKSQD